MQVLQDPQMGTGEREGYWGPWHIPLNVNRGPHTHPTLCQALPKCPILLKLHTTSFNSSFCSSPSSR